MDLSTISDEELEKLASPGDLSSIPDSELEKMAGVEEPGIMDKVKSAYDFLSPAAQYEKQNPGKHVVGGTPLDNPIFGNSVPGGVVSRAAGALGDVATSAATKFATSPLPGKISDATNVVSHGKNLASKFMSSMPELPGKLGTARDLVTGAIGRKFAYSNPVTGLAQGVSDAAKVTQKAQQGVAWILDNAPQKLGKFAPALQNAAQKGAGALATTDFILSQSNPEYQSMKKKAEEQSDH